MSWITDLIKELRLLGVHKEKIALVEFKLSETDKALTVAETALSQCTKDKIELQSQLDEAKNQIQQLRGHIDVVEREKQQLQAETYKTQELHTNLLNELEEQILIAIGQQGGSCNKFGLECQLGLNLHEKGMQEINQVTLDRNLSKLKEKGYIESNEDSRSIYEQVTYSLTDKGRDYLIDNKLL